MSHGRRCQYVWILSRAAIRRERGCVRGRSIVVQKRLCRIFWGVRVSSCIHYRSSAFSMLLRLALFENIAFGYHLLHMTCRAYAYHMHFVPPFGCKRWKNRYLFTESNVQKASPTFNGGVYPRYGLIVVEVVEDVFPMWRRRINISEWQYCSIQTQRWMLKMGSFPVK